MLGALFAAADRRTPEQAARVALDDALIAEIPAAEVVVLSGGGVTKPGSGSNVRARTKIRV